jgi:hypothetical protein
MKEKNYMWWAQPPSSLFPLPSWKWEVIASPSSCFLCTSGHTQWGCGGACLALLTCVLDPLTLMGRANLLTNFELCPPVEPFLVI